MASPVFALTCHLETNRDRGSRCRLVSARQIPSGDSVVTGAQSRFPVVLVGEAE